MADTSESGGLGGLAIGGIATVVVVVGGIALTQMGLFDRSSGPEVSDPEIRQQSDTQRATPDLVDNGAQDTAITEAEPAPLKGSSQIPQGGTASDGPEAAQVQTSETQTQSNDDIAAVDPSAARPVAPKASAVVAVDTPEGPSPTDPSTTRTPDAAIADAPQTTDAGEDLRAPEIDIIRFATDGSGLIAGRGQVGTQVVVLLDGEVIGQVDIPAGEEFVTFPFIAPTDHPRVVTIETRRGAKRQVAEASFILAPVSPTRQHAEAEAASDPADHETSADLSTGAETVVTGDVETASEDVVAKTAQLNQDVADPARPATEAQAAQADTAAIDLAEGAVTSAVAAPAATPDVTELARAPKTSAVPEIEPAPLVAVLKSGPDGVEVVQPAAPAVPELVGKVALDTISYSDVGDVQLAGRARPQALVRVYVDNIVVAEIETALDGRWESDLDGVDPGLFTLRLDEIDPVIGTVTSRMETPFKREAPETLAQSTGLDENGQTRPVVRAITVQEGDTLWAISQERYGNGLLFVRVFEANKSVIRDPDLIYPGQLFTLPK